MDDDDEELAAAEAAMHRLRTHKERPVEASYRKGKKYLGGREIDPAVRYWVYGSDDETVYTATKWADGTTSCNCPGWTRGKGDGFRDCKHSRRVATMTQSYAEPGIIVRPSAMPPDMAASAGVAPAVVAAPAPRPAALGPAERGLELDDAGD